MGGLLGTLPGRGKVRAAPLHTQDGEISVARTSVQTGFCFTPAPSVGVCVIPSNLVTTDDCNPPKFLLKCCVTVILSLILQGLVISVQINDIIEDYDSPPFETA